MDNRRLLISARKYICGVLLLIIQRPGLSYWYGHNFGTIPFFHSSLGMTPFQALYGREPPALLRYNDSSQDPPTVREVLHNRQMLLNRLKGNLIKAQTAMKIQANKKRLDRKFQVGDEVLVKLQPYKLQLPDTTKIHHKNPCIILIHSRCLRKLAKYSSSTHSMARL